MEFEGANTVAQIFQGVAFLALAIFLIFANNAKVGGGSRAPLETRYQTALTIATAVCLFSGFFNILQMTGVLHLSWNFLWLPRGKFRMFLRLALDLD